MSLVSGGQSPVDTFAVWNTFSEGIVSPQVQITLMQQYASLSSQSPSPSSSSSSSLSSSTLLPPSSVRSASSGISPSLLITHLLSFTLFVNKNESEASSSSPPSTSKPEYHSSSSNPPPFSLSSSSTSPSVRLQANPTHKRPFSVPVKASGLKSDKSRIRPPSHESTLAVINIGLAQYFDPIAIGLGILGNCLLCLVFLLTPLRARPLSHVLSGIGITDLIYVITSLLVYLATKEKPVFDAPGACQVTMFASLLSRSLQAWYLLIAHLDRLNAHFHSSFERRKRRVFNTKFALVVMAMLAGSLSVHVLWSFETVEFAGMTYCLPMRDSMQYYLTLRKFHVLTSVIIPMAIMAGVDLLLFLKFSLYLLCKRDCDDEDDMADDIGGLNTYNGCPAADSSFCTDKIMRFPLNEKKAEQYEHILANGVAGNAHGITHLSTIKETTSSDNNSGSLRCFTQSLKAGHGNIDVNLGQEAIKEKLTQVDMQNDMPSAKKREVAQYILTLSEDYTATKANEKHAHLTPTLEKMTEEQQKENDYQKRRSDEAHQNNAKDNLSEATKVSGYGQNVADKRKNLSSRFNHSVSHYSHSASHFRSCDFNSFTSYVSRNTIIPEDHIFSDDVLSCSVTTIISGLALAVLILPSAYTECRSLFLSTERPTQNAIEQALLFESFVKFNAVYKIVLYVMALGSFRQAFVWLLTEWIPKKFTGSSKMSAFNSNVKNDIVFV